MQKIGNLAGSEKVDTGILIFADVFIRNTEPLQFLYSLILRIYLKSEMAKSNRLRTGNPTGR